MSDEIWSLFKINNIVEVVENDIFFLFLTDAMSERYDTCKWNYGNFCICLWSVYCNLHFHMLSIS